MASSANYMVPFLNGAHINYGNFNNSASSSVTSNIPRTAYINVATIYLIYTNSYTNATGGDNVNTNNITVKAALSDGTNRYPVWFPNGSRNYTLEPGAWVVGRCEIEVPTGSFNEYCMVSVPTAATDKWPSCFSGNGILNTDSVDSGSSFPTTVNAYGASAMIAIPAASPSYGTVALWHDSLGDGTGDSTGAGFMVRALGPAGIPYIKLGTSGLRVQTTGPMLNRQSRTVMSEISGANYFIDNMSINDVKNNRTLAQIQADKISLWKAEYWRGVRGYSCTLTPNTNSTDSWATATNQTLVNSSQNTVRVNLNTWLRDGAPVVSASNLTPVATGAAGLRAGATGHPLLGVYDVAGPVEVDSTNTVTLNGGLWKATWTTDGLHPTDPGHAAMAALIPTSSFPAVSSSSSGGGGGSNVIFIGF